MIVGDSLFAEIAYEYFTHDLPYEVVAFAVERDYRKRDDDQPERERASDAGRARIAFAFHRVRNGRLSAERGADRGEQQQPSGAERDARADAAAGEPRREEQRPEPARHGDAGQQAQPSDFAIAGLPQQLELQRALGAVALRLELLALELQPPRVAVERLFERRHDDARKTRFEAAERPSGIGLLQRLVLRRHRSHPAAARQIGDADQRVENAEPGNCHNWLLE